MPVTNSLLHMVAGLALSICLAGAGSGLWATGRAEAQGEAPDVVLQNDLCRYVIGADGSNRAFINRANAKDYCEPGHPFMLAGRGQQTWPSTAVRAAGKKLRISFGDSGLEVVARVETYPTHFTLTIESVRGEEPDWLQLCNLRLSITENVGTLVNAAWESSFGACVLACNDRTHSFGADGARAALCARCYREYGLVGAKVAIIGTPTGGPDPAGRLLEAIGRVEQAEGLPHPMLNGVWIKQAKERLYSYLMVHNLSENNVQDVIDLARGGFGCIEFYPWRSTPSYRLNEGLFPHGMAGLKKVCDQIHAAGLQVGLHVMQSMVGWGPKDDPYITPRADPRLLQDRRGTLAADVDAAATTLELAEGTEGWPEAGDLFVDGEIIRYARRTPNGFTECQRGLWGTTVSPHRKGTTIGHLVNCFPIWGGCVYCPDVRTDMIDEVCQRIADVFNAVGADMSYFDGGEELAVQPPQWRNLGLVALGVMKRLRKPVILEGNALYTHLSWHVITRGSPSYDPIYFGRREYTLRFKGQNPAGWAKNLLTGDVGWFAPHVHSLTTDAVTPDEVMLLCLKAVGGKAPISFHADGENPWANRRMPEMLEIIRACDELKRTDYFTQQALAELSRPMAEHVLEQLPSGEWSLRPMQFGPSRTVNASRGERASWQYNNPYAPQTPWLRIRARTHLAPYAAKENIVLADFEEGMPFVPMGTASPALTQTVEPSPERAPDGAAAFRWTAENRASAPSGWCQLTHRLPVPVDLTTHRRLGVWVHADGQGGILNFQLAATDARRDHCIRLDFTGWRYFELDTPDDRTYWQYGWPYSWTDLFYTCQPVYNATREVNLFYNGLPASSKVTCLISRIEALAEKYLPLRNPTLETQGQRLEVPVILKPDEYIEIDWAGQCRHFDPNGGLLGQPRPHGRLRLAHGENELRFTCEGGPEASQYAEITVAVRGEPLAGIRRPGAKTRGRYPSLMPNRPPSADELKVLPTRTGKLRVVLGPYELAGGPPAHTITAFDGVGNVWEVVNDTGQPQRAAVVIACEGGADKASYADPRAITIESFDDLTPYEMSERNQFEKYVIGGGKQLAPCGPVREGVCQTFASAAEDARVGKRCGVYAATNSGAGGGWCAKGRRFERPLDLSGFSEVAFWLHGDGKGETLRFQFRDVDGRHADWLVKIDFVGWRLQRCRLADMPNFDWKRVEYLIFYFNDLPANSTCTLKFDDLRALPKDGRPAGRLRRPCMHVNGQRLDFPVTLAAGEALALDGLGRASVWAAGKRRGGSFLAANAPVVLKPGVNRLLLTCSDPAQAPDLVLVRVLTLGPP